ncbi:MAG: SNF2-related protein [Gammaproteobacteria bacterium]
MIVLHASTLGERFFLWAEQAAEAPPEATDLDATTLDDALDGTDATGDEEAALETQAEEGDLDGDGFDEAMEDDGEGRGEVGATARGNGATSDPWAGTADDETPEPRPHPFTADAERLGKLLAAVPGGVASGREALKVNAWLPSVPEAPVASSALVAELPDPKTELRLHPWMVSGISVPASEAVDLLAYCAGRTTLAPGIVVGADLSWCSAAMRMAGSLVARQRWLPGLTQQGDCVRARWTATPLGDDEQRLDELARRMPAAVRAVMPVDAELAPAQAPGEVARALTDLMLDALIRDAVGLPSPQKSDDAINEVGSEKETNRAVAGKTGAGKTGAGKTGTRKKTGTTAKGRKTNGATRSDATAESAQRQSVDSVAFASPHDAWMYALRHEDAVVHGEKTAVAQLLEQFNEWRRPVELGRRSPYQLCFRLEEPGQGRAQRGKNGREGAPDEWRVRYLLHPHGDQSLLIHARDVWRAPRGRRSPVRRADREQVREYLASALDQAARLSDDVADSLQSSEPTGFGLDATGAHRFLRHTEGLLRRAGFGVLLPKWWGRNGAEQQLSIRAQVKSPRTRESEAVSALDERVRFDWELALGGRKLSLKELEGLAKHRAPLVKVRGQWVEMSEETIQSAIEFWSTRTRSRQTTVRELVQLSLGAGITLGNLGFEGVHATGWVGDLLKKLSGEVKPRGIAPPSNFVGTLRPYQMGGYAWLAFLSEHGLGACLADDMGLGKTVQALALFEQRREAGEKRPVLLLCPTSVVSNWQREAERFTPGLSVMVHHGVSRSKDDSFARDAARHNMVISSYGLLQRDAEFMQKVEWSAVVLDEAQNIKNPETKQARAARELKADYRIALTGTPVENSVADLWSIMEFLNPGFLGTLADFRKRFFIPIQARQDTEAAAHLKRITAPFIMRRLKTDRSIIRDLPDKQEMKVYCNLTHEQADLYAQVVADAEEELNNAEGIARKGVVLATLTKLKQVCNHPAHFKGDGSAMADRSGKASRLVEMLEEMHAVGERALVFTQFARMGTMLKSHLENAFGNEVLFLHGGVNRRQRDRMVSRFQHRAGPPIFILSLKAGGTGLNLTRANHVFHFDRWWNPAVENQATDRAFRIGQTNQVQVHKFITAGTLEEKVDEIIERKTSLAEELVGAGEGWLTELSNDEINDLIALRPEAVGD